MSFQATGPSHCLYCHQDVHYRDAADHSMECLLREEGISPCTVKCGKWYESDFDRFAKENPHCEECRKAMDEPKGI